jgi:uncharacterized membrane protein
MASNDNAKFYQDKKAKAEDFKSSAYTLLLVGVVGLVALVLINMGVLPIILVGSGKIMTNIVMGALFLIFIVIGISSFKSSKQYEKEAVDEDDLTKKISSWVRENLTEDSIKEEVYFDEGTPDEMKYFKYSEVLKSKIIEEFGNVNASYLDALCDELYSEIFGEIE